MRWLVALFREVFRPLFSSCDDFYKKLRNEIQVETEYLRFLTLLIFDFHKLFELKIIFSTAFFFFYVGIVLKFVFQALIKTSFWII